LTQNITFSMGNLLHRANKPSDVSATIRETRWRLCWRRLFVHYTTAKCRD